MTIFCIPNPTQYLNLTTTLLLIRSKLGVYWEKIYKIKGLLIVNLKIKYGQLFLSCIKV